METIKLLFFILLTNMLSVNAIGQEVEVERLDPDRFVFWMLIRADIKVSKESKKEVYVVRSTRKDPQSGKVFEYEKFLWKTLTKGRYIPIGPFMEYKDGIRAAGMYDLAGKTSRTMEKEISNFKDTSGINEFYWFFLKFKITPRNRKIELIRTAARVASGTLKDFKQVLWEGLSFEQLAIGPFTSQYEAEEAKRLYRLEEY